MLKAELSVVLLACATILQWSPTTAHLCLLSPPQRGPLDGLNKPGAKACMMVQGPCGSTPRPKAPPSMLLAGHNYTVIFQKNLDHFNKASPGYFALSIDKHLSSTFTEIVRIPDGPEPSLHLYTIDITLPTAPLPWYTLQAKYVTNNPDAPKAFYQCADFVIIKK